nr:hypothetical protein 10 [bacterium]
MIPNVHQDTEKPFRGRCPICGHLFEYATNLNDGNAKPKIGDISFCIKCGAFNQFDEFGVKPLEESGLDNAMRDEIAWIRAAWKISKEQKT